MTVAMPFLYKLGSLKALGTLGFKVATYNNVSGSDGLGFGTGFGSAPSGEGKSYWGGHGARDAHETAFKGTPFPDKSQTINAERLAQILRSQEDEPSHISSENRRNDSWDRPVTWSASQNMSGLDAGHQVAGIMMPGNPRG